MRNISTIKSEIISEESALTDLRERLSNEELALQALKQQSDELKKYILLLSKSQDKIIGIPESLEVYVKDDIRQAIGGESGNNLANTTDKSIEMCVKATHSISQVLLIGNEDRKKLGAKIANKEDVILDIKNQINKKEIVIIKLKRELNTISYN